ncbi:DNA cytosine methyltransferase [Marinilongibacter aquaticus]|uniref:DNA cytosine methyltransferase n=1 Tax=Marinilongibacter aquaticus TaxID=2975157 RepID=UPI0021BD4200|nr:DNA cytosine methyltransferase [Marinilongibacter aquaticus]UBM58263.1 DNA cytosine methyltransferase [Marinilongibacter aquaticus]
MTKSKDVQYIIVDLFCGFGGTTLAFSSVPGYKVIAAVNHDPKAIKSHWLNHPEVQHFEEDIRTLDLFELQKVVAAARRKYAKAKLILWASLECTNFSKAKGGQPRDADSRTLANHLFRYIDSLDPFLIMIENVVEFMCWGPLDRNGKPISRKKGKDWLAWRKRICARGYKDDWKELNAANYGAYTSRNRLFGIFAKDPIFLAWPKQTHIKPGKKADIPNLKPWKAVKNCLDFKDEGESIFTRKKPLVEATLQRIYAGLVKFVADGDESFILKYNSTNSNGKHFPPGINEPCPTVACQNRLGTVFISKYYSGSPEGKNISIEAPAGTVTCKDHHSMVSANFLQHYYGNGFCTGMDEPSPTVRTKDGIGFITSQYSSGQKNRGLDLPNPTVLSNPKQSVCRTFLLNPQYGGHNWSIERPCFTLIARMDKSPPYLITASSGHFDIAIYESDSPGMKNIKYLMAEYNIVDIKMRMLRVRELLKIMGFPEDYRMVGNQTDQKKCIGNAVEKNVVMAIAMSNLEISKQMKTAARVA